MSSSTAKAAGSSSNVQTAASANLTGARCKPSSVASSGNGPASGQQPSSLSFSSSAAFQQVKQTQASLARLSRVHHHQQQQHQYNHNQHLSQTNQSSQQVSSKESNSALSQPTPSKSTTFIDCLIRRFKDCFSEDFCTVPMFVVGNLSPGSDGK